MKVFIDHNISPRIARTLAAMAGPDGHEVVAKSEMFEAGASVPDVQWLDTLGRDGGWAFISDDQRIWRNPLERSAMIRAKLIAFFLEPAWRKRNVSEYERAARLLLWWPRLMSTCEMVQAPAAYRLPFAAGSRLRPIALPRR